ncbi:MAG TPA: ATP-binding cassette domain-containing protein [Steroidobacteraceae bacterium]|nr:ATP-binding cassette domain-containing protein [Steroidobacteraceae bacterium]
MSAIEFQGVSLAMGGRPVLEGVELAVEAGELIGVLGANGAGKTTLMRAVLGLVTPTAGSIRVLGRPVERGNPAVGYMPQTRTLETTHRLSGWTFVASAAGGNRWGLPRLRPEARRDLEWAIDAVGGRAFAQRMLVELSGGERQRLLLAQALLGRPRLLLLDEPLISLDPHHQRSVIELVRGIQRELGVTVLLSAHELNPLLDVVDRVLYLGNRQAALGTVDEVITGASLSRLYGAEIEVLRHNGRIFVMSGGLEIDRDEHRHV